MTATERRRARPELTPTDRYHWWQFDGATLLTIWMVLLLAIPQRWILPVGGAIARPSIVMALGCGGVYALSRLSPSLSTVGRNPVALGLYAYGTIVVMTMLLAFNRDLAGHEVNAGYREVVFTTAMIAIALTLSAIPDRARFELVLKRLVILGGAVAFVALIQFYLNYDLVAQFQYPGLVLNGAELERSGLRSGFSRATSTTAHAIELGILMAMLLPLALHYALHEPVRRKAIGYWFATACMAATLPTTVSRSAVVAIFLALGSLIPVWSSRQLARSLTAGLFMTVVIYASSPTLLGSILSLFRNADSDPSIEGRTDDYEIAFNFIAERPWFGRGAGTWGSDTYLLLDNQFLLSLLEVGWIGVIVLSFMFGLAMVFARDIRHEARDNTTRHLGQVLFGSLLSGFVSMFFVDALYYQMYIGVTFVIIGAIGGLHRMMYDQPAPDAVEAVAQRRQLLGQRHTTESKPRWWTVATARDIRDVYRNRRV